MRERKCRRGNEERARARRSRRVGRADGRFPWVKLQGIPDAWGKKRFSFFFYFQVSYSIRINLIACSHVPL